MVKCIVLVLQSQRAAFVAVTLNFLCNPLLMLRSEEAHLEGTKVLYIYI